MAILILACSPETAVSREQEAQGLGVADIVKHSQAELKMSPISTSLCAFLSPGIMMEILILPENYRLV